MMNHVFTAPMNSDAGSCGRVEVNQYKGFSNCFFWCIDAWKSRHIGKCTQYRHVQVKGRGGRA